MPGFFTVAVAIMAVSTILAAVLAMVFPNVGKGAERWGLAGLGSLAWLGFLPSVFRDFTQIRTTFAFGLISIVGLALALVLGVPSSERKFNLRLDKVGPGLLAGMLVLIACVLPLVKGLAPGTMMDWDTYAYHFAVPKIWLEQGGPVYLPTIHQSNFPAIIDNLFLYGLSFDESGARAFTVLHLLFGGAALFGFAQRRFGDWAAVVANLAFVSAPIVVWTAGSGYVDLGHGLYMGLGILYALEACFDEFNAAKLFFAALLVGCGLASKYTGLQYSLILVILALYGLRGAGKMGTLTLGYGVIAALVIAAPWYVRNIQNTGNPVYPFFYKQLGGKGWSPELAAIYTDEQKSFGVGSAGIEKLGHAILGLSYVPGRYINPGQTMGLGAPEGAIGGLLLLGPLAIVLLRGAPRSLRAFAVLTGVALLFWFFLSQQVRYTSALLPGFALGIAWASAHYRKLAPIFGLLGIAQLSFTIWLIYQHETSVRLPVLQGQLQPDEFLDQNISFFGASQDIGAMSSPEEDKVALYDEVFGYFLNCPYIWANPGHSTLLPYAQMGNVGDLEKALKDQKVTMVYVNLRWQSPEIREEFAQLLTGENDTLDPSLRNQLMGALQSKWIPLVFDFVATGKARGLNTYPRIQPSGRPRNAPPVITGFMFALK